MVRPPRQEQKHPQKSMNVDIDRQAHTSNHTQAIMRAHASTRAHTHNNKHIQTHTHSYITHTHAHTCTYTNLHSI